MAAAAPVKVVPLGLRANHMGPIQKLAPYTGIDYEKGDFKKRAKLNDDGTPQVDVNGKPVFEARTSYSVEIYGMGWKLRVDCTPEEYADFEHGETYDLEFVVQTTDYGTRLTLIEAEHKPTKAAGPAGLTRAG